MMRTIRAVAAGLWLILLIGTARADDESSATHPPLTLAAAIRLAVNHQPVLLSARGATEAATGLAEQARGSLLPQLTGTASYQRRTGNFVPSPGSVPKSVDGTSASTATFNSYNTWYVGASLTQQIYDFNKTIDLYRSQRVAEAASRLNEQATRAQVIFAVRTSFFLVCATRTLVQVANDALVSQKHHLDQTVDFVKNGLQPEIALAQANTNYANSRVQSILAQNNYELAKAQLNQAMAVEPTRDYDVVEEPFPALPGEDEMLEDLLPAARAARADVRAQRETVTSERLQVRAAWEALAPALVIQLNVSDAGLQPDQLVWNWNVIVGLSGHLFDGLATEGLARQQRGQLIAAEAGLAQLDQKVRLDVEQALLAIRAAKETVVAAAEALVAGRKQLRLAEGRYRSGLGNMIELADAQSASTAAESQKVQADYALATARAQLAYAVGL